MQLNPWMKWLRNGVSIGMDSAGLIAGFFSPYQGFNMKMIVNFFFLTRKALLLA